MSYRRTHFTGGNCNANTVASGHLPSAIFEGTWYVNMAVQVVYHQWLITVLISVSMKTGLLGNVESHMILLHLLTKLLQLDFQGAVGLHLMTGMDGMFQQHFL